VKTDTKILKPGKENMSQKIKTKQQVCVVIVALVMGGASFSAQAATLRSFGHHDDSNFKTSRFGTLELRQGEAWSKFTPSWSATVRQCLSPEDISCAVKSRVKYADDAYDKDEWQCGEDTWDKGTGDCEDYAAAVRDMCVEKGIDAEIYIVRSRTDSKAHAVTVGRWNGRVWVSSNGTYSDYQSMFDAKEDLARDLGWWAPETEMAKVVKSEKNGDHGYAKVAARAL
jgi:predicted transglutaminase-like cysteine proteinase